MEPLQRVSRHQPCPICSRTNGCSFNSQLVICLRVAGDKEAGGLGGWVHYIKGPVEKRPPSEKRRPKQADLAPLWKRHKVYRDMLSLLTLSKEHEANLLSRGLSPMGIRRRQYRSLPEQARSDVAKGMSALHQSLWGVPGFAPTQRRGHWMMSRGASGILVPVRSIDGRIEAFQVRRDVPISGQPRYVWLTSAGLFGGSSPGAPAHVARPLSLKQRDLVIVTEGPLKADITAELTGLVTIGVPGVGTWRTALPILERISPEAVVVAYDMGDLYGNEHVYLQYRKLVTGLVEAQFRVLVARWDSRFGKGIDDVLANGEPVKLFRWPTENMRAGFAGSLAAS